VTLTTHPHLVPRSSMNPAALVVCVEVSRELYFTFAKSNEVCVLVMLKVQVMYIIFH
jgi:hypothetical protein